MHFDLKAVGITCLCLLCFLILSSAFQLICLGFFCFSLSIEEYFYFLSLFLNLLAYRFNALSFMFTFCFLIDFIFHKGYIFSQPFQS